MAKCKVWNDNPKTDWKESFKGEMLTIPSGKFIEMEFYEAHEFKGQYSPIRILGDETQDPRSYKMIRVEKIIEEQGEIEVQEIFPCNLCKKKFDSEASLEKHSQSSHADRVIVDELAEEAMPKKKMGRPAKSESVMA